MWIVWAPENRSARSAQRAQLLQQQRQPAQLLIHMKRTLESDASDAAISAIRMQCKVRLTASSLYSQGARMESQKVLGSEIEQRKIFGLAGVCSGCAV